MKQLKQRIEDLSFAIRITEVSFRNADSPYYKDLHLAAIEYYKKEILVAESQLMIYNNASSQEQ